MLVLKGLVGLHRTIQFSFFSVTGWGIDLDYCDIEWFTLEMNRDHSVVFKMAPKHCLSDHFVIGDWNAKVGSQEIPGVTGKFGLGVQSEAGKRLMEFCQENALVIANTIFQQHKRQLYTWTSPDGKYQNHFDYILCSQKWKSSIASTRPGADCGSDHGKLL